MVLAAAASDSVERVGLAMPLGRHGYIAVGPGAPEEGLAGFAASSCYVFAPPAARVQKRRKALLVALGLAGAAAAATACWCYISSPVQHARKEEKLLLTQLAGLRHNASLGKSKGQQSPRDCAAEGENCFESKCCRDSGRHCVQENNTLALCKRHCVPSENSSCHVIPGEKRPGSVAGGRHEGSGHRNCSREGENCIATHCCESPGLRCFQKHGRYGLCMRRCTPGIDLSEPESAQTTWACTLLQRPDADNRTVTQAESASPAAAENASAAAEDSSVVAENSSDVENISSRADNASQQVEDSRAHSSAAWAGSPAAAVAGHLAAAEAAAAAAPEEASAAASATSSSGGPRGSSTSTSASSRSSSSSSTSIRSTSPTTSTSSSSSTTVLPAGNAGLSMFCFSVTMTDGYELELVKEQYKHRVGIFGCDSWSVFSSYSISLGRGAESLAIGGAPVIIGLQPGSNYTMAFNGDIFLRAWAKVKAMGQFRRYDWTVKVDIDAVFFPYRLRSKLAELPEHRDRSVYIKNCKLFHSMQGPLEVFSKQAVEKFTQHFDRCKEEVDWAHIGEDWLLSQCMELLGIKHLDDFELLSDWKCGDTAEPCTCHGEHAYMSAFHPCKSKESYFRCWREASMCEGCLTRFS